MINLRHFCQR